MSFRDRPRDEVTLTTRIDVVMGDDGADLLIDMAGPRVPWSLELTFRPPGLLRGAAETADGRWCLLGDTASYTAGGDQINVGVTVNSGDPLAGPGDVLGYDPGQDYTFLGGTDATTGTRLYLGGHTPQTVRVSLRA
jgi:hypothetical protein